MREIKFRAWDKVQKEWRYFTLKQLIVQANIHYWSDLENWCQYTGLKDKNGKEIYEGDIVVGKKEGMGEIDEFEVKPCRVDWNEEQSGYTLFGYYGSPLTAFYNLEVIGNIYENKDLLK